ncbi:MAG: helix-turn-helix domain-containing protein, partial [Waterburya sp.]
PKLIRTEEENENALTIVEELMHKQDRTIEEDELYELLITLIEKFEREYYSPGQASNSHSMLLFLMEQHNTNQEDLVKIIGSSEIVSSLINGEKEINKEQAKNLGKFFNVEPSLFLENNYERTGND